MITNKRRKAALKGWKIRRKNKPIQPLEDHKLNAIKK